MSIGESGRIVLEVDPQMKRQLYAVLAGNGLSLKAWFTKEAAAYIERSRQGQLFKSQAITEAVMDNKHDTKAPDVAP